MTGGGTCLIKITRQVLPRDTSDAKENLAKVLKRHLSNVFLGFEHEFAPKSAKYRAISPLRNSDGQPCLFIGIVYALQRKKPLLLIKRTRQ